MRSDTTTLGTARKGSGMNLVPPGGDQEWCVAVDSRPGGCRWRAQRTGREFWLDRAGFYLESAPPRGPRRGRG
jgi:hypothetical protein